MLWKGGVNVLCWGHNKNSEGKGAVEKGVVRGGEGKVVGREVVEVLGVCVQGREEGRV